MMKRFKRKKQSRKQVTQRRRLKAQVLEDRLVMAAGISPNVDIRDPNQQLARVTFDESNDSVFIGGGYNDARDIVGEEFAEITGGTRINADELDEILGAIFTSDRGEAPGLEGVDLVSVSSDSFTIAIDGRAGSKNFIEFSGSEAEAAIDGVLSQVGNDNYGLDLKNNRSQVTLFNTDDVNSIFVGSQSAASDEVDEIIRGSRLHVNEVADLYLAAVSGRADNGTAGLDGVELIGITDEGFALRIDAGGDTVDTIIIEGEAALEAIAQGDELRSTDLRDGFTAFDVFDLSQEDREFIGGTDGELRDVIGGQLEAGDVLNLFDALISGNGKACNTHGVADVTLVGLSATSFAIRIDSAGGNADFILFTNVYQLEGAADYGFVAPPPPVEAPESPFWIC